VPCTCFGTLCNAIGVLLSLLGPAFGAPWDALWALSGKSLKMIVQRGPNVDFSIDICGRIVGLEGSPALRGFRGSGVIKYLSGPPFYAYLGLG
jgi:hypothetical protein